MLEVAISAGHRDSAFSRCRPSEGPCLMSVSRTRASVLRTPRRTSPVQVTKITGWPRGTTSASSRRACSRLRSHRRRRMPAASPRPPCCTRLSATTSRACSTRHAIARSTGSAIRASSSASSKSSLRAACYVTGSCACAVAIAVTSGSSRSRARRAASVRRARAAGCRRRRRRAAPRPLSRYYGSSRRLRTCAAPAARRILDAPRGSSAAPEAARARDPTHLDDEEYASA